MILLEICPPRSHTVILKIMDFIFIIFILVLVRDGKKNDGKIIIVWTKDECVNWNEISRASWNYQKLNEFPLKKIIEKEEGKHAFTILICIFITAYNTRFVMDIRILLHSEYLLELITFYCRSSKPHTSSKHHMKWNNNFYFSLL